jgi:acyl-CoA synthetase (AMP-forming)/AMP-acid ligase II
MFFLNIAEAVAQNALRKPDHPALEQGDRVLGYAQLDRRVRQIAHRLRAAGLKKGDIIGLSLPDTIDHIAIMVGVFRMGAIVLPMDVRWTDAEKSRVAAFFGAKRIIAKDAPVSGFDTLVTDAVWEVAVEAADPSGFFPDDRDAPILLSLSSGTTGIPKGPLVTHRHMAMRFMGQCVSLGFNENDRNLLATPLYFGGGRGFTLCMLYLGGTTVFYPPPYQPKELIEEVNRENATVLFLVPTLLRRLLTLSEPGQVLMPKLRILISSGSILHAEERERIMDEISPNFVNLYSSTEGGSVSVLQSSIGTEKAGSVGRASYRTQFEVVDEEDRVVPAGEVGRIRHRSPWLPDGYYNNPEETEIYFKHGCYYTGDLGKVDEDSFLYVVGRTKDMIIRGGVNIYPAEIEETLLTHSGVHDTAVVAWESPELGEEVAAFVLREGDVEEAELIEHCRASLARYKVPKAVFFVEELPKNALGKVLKTELQKKLPRFSVGVT